MNCCMAAATSWLFVLESEVEVVPVDEVLELPVELEVLEPVTPICERASRMELIRPPP